MKLLFSYGVFLLVKIDTNKILPPSSKELESQEPVQKSNCTLRYFIEELAMEYKLYRNEAW